MILTDSKATARLYSDRLRVAPTPIGKLIPRAAYVSDHHTRQNLTFINPTAAKGGLLVAQLALYLENRRPDIRFEIVESRGTWAEAIKFVRRVTRKGGETVSNVTVTPNTPDMRPVYSRARVIFFPSLWWESGGRVLAEAMLNGIPAIVTDRGGPPEMIGDGGAKISLRRALHKAPYRKLLDTSELEATATLVERMFDDEAYYQDLVAKARTVGDEMHNIEKNTTRLETALRRILPKA